jgi:hypothetical protein
LGAGISIICNVHKVFNVWRKHLLILGSQEQSSNSNQLKFFPGDWLNLIENIHDKNEDKKKKKKEMCPKSHLTRTLGLWAGEGEKEPTPREVPVVSVHALFQGTGDLDLTVGTADNNR